MKQFDFNDTKIITFRGSVGVGKTSIKTELIKLIKAKFPEEVIDIDEPAVHPLLKGVLAETLESNAKQHNDTKNSFQLLMLGMKIGQFINIHKIATKHKEMNVGFVILDRDWQEDKIFMDLYGYKDDPVYFKVYNKLEEARPNNTISIFVTSPLDIQLERYSKREGKRIEEVRDYINEVNTMYEQHPEISNPDNNTIVVYNNGDKTIKEIAKEIFIELFGKL